MWKIMPVFYKLVKNLFLTITSIVYGFELKMRNRHFGEATSLEMIHFQSKTRYFLEVLIKFCLLKTL